VELPSIGQGFRLLVVRAVQTPEEDFKVNGNGDKCGGQGVSAKAMADPMTGVGSTRGVGMFCVEYVGSAVVGANVGVVAATRQARLLRPAGLLS
jgi:hypothetical protein